MPWTKHLEPQQLPRAMRLLYAVLDSSVLGERILVVADDRAEIPADLAGLVRYSAQELDALRADRPTATELRTIHATKQIFTGARVLIRRAV